MAEVITTQRRILQPKIRVSPTKVATIIAEHPVAFYCYNNWEVVDESLFEVFPYPMLMEVTPQFAQEVLDDHNVKNRLIQKDRVEMYARLMRQGDWKPINQIVFHRNGRLLNGQHRLMAVVKADMPIMFHVLFGADDSYITAIDEAPKRSNTDISHLMGLDFSGKVMSTAKFMLLMRGKDKHRSRNEDIAFCQERIDKLRLVTSVLKTTCREKKGMTISPVQAAFVCASYHVPEEQLVEIMNLLMSGSHEFDDEPIWRLREYLMTADLGGTTERANVYRKTENAIRLHVSGKRAVHLQAPRTELFPVPILDD